TFVIIRREYTEVVRKKSFWMGMFSVPLIMGIAFVVPFLLTKVKVDQQKRLAVIDGTGTIYEAFAAGLDGKLKDGRSEYRLEQVYGEDVDAARKRLSEAIIKDKLDAYLVIPADIYEQGKATYYGKNVSDPIETRRLRDLLTRIVVEHRLDRRGLDPVLVRKWTQRVSLGSVKVEKGGEKESGFGEEFLSSFAFVMVLYMMVILYGVMVMRGVLEEKASRTVEVVISSVKAWQLMTGKIVGLCAAALTQIGVWLLAVLAMTKGFGLVTGKALPVDIGLNTMLFFVVFFILGFFFYATIYATMGAIYNSEQDAQNMQMFAIMPLVLTIILAQLVIRLPDAPISVVLSLVPLFSPILMFVRINVLMPPWIEIVGSIVILLVTIWGMMRMAGRVFRVGILMYGKQPTLPEILRWIRTP
ncbi:MAG: ABC transporter permease, partial [bacterium]|nr:ABC transporter permease [bacterium]